jgi:hypothetical protein
MTRHAAGLVLALAGTAALLGTAWRAPASPEPETQRSGEIDLIQELNEAVAATAARYLVLKGRVTSGETGLHGATVMVARDGERSDPASCQEPECTRRTTTTDGQFSLDLTRIQARNGDPVFISVVRDGYEFFSRELEVDVRAMDIRTAPQTVVLAARSVP